MPHGQGHQLDYAARPAPKHRPFLTRPFWRDYVLAYVCIGVGAVVAGAPAPARGSGNIVLLAAAALICGAGLVIFCCALVFSARPVLRRPAGVASPTRPPDSLFASASM
jgi:hypothetical protein